MKEIKRYSTDAYGIDEDKNGKYCKYSDVKKLQARIKELEVDNARLKKLIATMEIRN